MIRTRVDNRKFTEIPTHYIIWYEWDRVKTNELHKIVWAINKDLYNTQEQVIDWNSNWIHIEMVWNYSINNPTFEQYKTLKEIIWWIKQKYPDIQIRYHSDFASKTCPWKLFNRDFMTMTEFSLSRYYSPQVNQERYYNWKSYEEDVCMNCWCKKDNTWKIIQIYDCKKPANWITLKQKQRWKVVACPKEYPLWTKFYIEWIWEVICVDRWWAITWNRLDLRCWYWMNALNNRDTCPTWKRLWYVLPS